ncbi:hypothetical protein BKA70DRAFT_1423197 [Coprinopsis sp. MPI-PUGE-AT-0042]|nr:hypothetical protein BKA70DRAFT_1423197 [Coprinopsis sp. MPI-PUGE-AT-0042]
MTFTRNLKFVCEDLGKNVTLLLTFDDAEANPGTYTQYQPTAFKVLGFGATGANMATVSFESQLVFTKPHVGSDDIIESSASHKIQLGEETELKLIQELPVKIYGFSKPTEGSPNAITAHNKADITVDFGVGFQDPRNKPTVLTAIVFRDIRENDTVRVAFTPVLRGYFTTGFQPQQLLTAQVQSKLAFSQNLEQLNEDTTWIIKHRDDGLLTITQAY